MTKTGTEAEKVSKFDYFGVFIVNIKNVATFIISGHWN